MDMVIKQMETADEITGKVYVHWKSWQETYRGIVDRQFLDELTLEKCESIARGRFDNTLIAKDGDAVIGFVSYGRYRGDELENTGEIYAIYVLAEYHGRGAGYRLMQEALSQLSEYPTIAVWVLKGNEKAIQFYMRCGYRLDGGEETLLLGSPVTAVRMILENCG